MTRYAARTEQEWLAWANENLPSELVKQYKQLVKWAQLLASQHTWLAPSRSKATG